jgi:hypothetical protein
MPERNFFKKASSIGTMPRIISATNPGNTAKANPGKTAAKANSGKTMTTMISITIISM